MKKVLEKQRNSTIELLRILCILMIVFMHLVGIWWDYCDNLFDKEFVIFVNSLCNCAVTIFMLISGYYGIRFNLRKIVQFEMMVIFYSILFIFMQMYYNVNSNTLYGRLFMELNNTIATPLYKQLEEKLQHEIETGERPAGSRLPTENELSETYHVSRVTVRKALAGLSELGYLDRKSGKGTFVAEKKLHRSITEVISFTDMCRMMNATAGAKTIKIALEEPSEREIKEMSLKPGEKILVLERIRYMDDEPVIIELNKFPESFSFLFGEDLNDTSLFEVLKKHNIILDHSRKTLDIIFASPQEAKALNINKGYPLLRIKSTIHDVENTITNLCQQLCIGDKFTFIV